MNKIRYICPNCNKINQIPLKDSYKRASCGSCKSSLLDGKVIESNDSNFNYIVSNSSIVIVDFWAPWCGPCQMMSPNFQEASKILSPKVHVCQIKYSG